MTNSPQNFEGGKDDDAPAWPFAFVSVSSAHRVVCARQGSPVNRRSTMMTTVPLKHKRGLRVRPSEAQYWWAMRTIAQQVGYEMRAKLDDTRLPPHERDFCSEIHRACVIFITAIDDYDANTS